MTRRESLRTGFLLAMAIALGKMDALKASEGQLTCDLSQWGAIVVKLHGEGIRIPVAEVFAALKGVSSGKA